MKVLRIVWFILFTALVTVAFVYPFYSVPERFEQKARSMTLARIEESGTEVDQSYVDQSVREAMQQNTPEILRTAFLTACCLALIVYLVSIRPPHDCGGINWFNPLALIFVVSITLLMGLVMIKFGPELLRDRWVEMNALAERLKEFASDSWHGLPYMFIVAVMLEVIFRGIVFSYLERIHAIVAIVLSPIIYGMCVYLAANPAAELLGEYYGAPLGFAAAACFIGLIEGLMTWRLRSGIPAVLSHLLLVYSAPGLGVIAEESRTPAAMLVAVLGVIILVFMLLPLLSNRVRMLAIDYPFTVHHIRMHEWLYGRGFKTGYKASSLTPEERSALEIRTRAEAAAGRKPEEKKESAAKPAEDGGKDAKRGSKAEKKAARKAKEAPAGSASTAPAKADSKAAAKDASPAKETAAKPAAKKETQAHDPKAADEKKRAAGVKGSSETEANVPAKGN